MSREVIFAMYFSTIAGWQFHPGSGHGESKVLSLEQARDYALQMVDIHQSLFGGEPWPLGAH